MGSFQNQYMMAHGTVSGIAAGQGFNGAGISEVPDNSNKVKDMSEIEDVGCSVLFL